MKPTCPKCKSEEIKEIESAHFIGEYGSAFQKKEPRRYECEKCEYSGLKKEFNTPI